MIWIFSNTVNVWNRRVKQKAKSRVDSVITSLSDFVIKGTKHKYNLKMALKVRQSLFHLMRFFLSSAVVNNVFLSSVIKKTIREANVR